MTKSSKMIFAVVAGIIVAITSIMLVVTMTSSLRDAVSGEEGKDLPELMTKFQYNVAEPVKGAVSLGDTSLFDEVPDINKYPLAVQGTGKVDIEIFTSGEKAGTDYDSWLIDCANDFNSQRFTLESGETVSISVRSVSSGLAADYIISGRYYPDLYTPSNQLFGEYAIANKASLTLQCERLVGNTAGILVAKDSKYDDVDSIVEAVMNGELNIGYTNPQTSATGLNLLIELLQTHGGITSDSAKGAFAKFNNNIPFVAYTTQQMASSATSGTLDGMVTEYQAYINSRSLTTAYKFIPFGVRHDNPLYIVNKGSKSAAELAAIDIISEYLTSEACQKRATECGFNALDDYKGSQNPTGMDVSQALQVYKLEKDAGKDIIAVFVADCSGSMSGDAINELKASLTNGMQYINENNYIGLVSYNSTVTLEVPIAKFDLNQKAYFQGAVNRFNANGSTCSYEAVCLALSMIEDARADHPDAKCMIFLLSDGYANGAFHISTITSAVQKAQVPIYTIGYTSSADMQELQQLSNINEAACISADSEDIVYKIKSLFNAQL